MKGGILIGSTIFCAAVIDRAAKFIIERPFFDTTVIGWRYFAIERFHNPGIAFGIPIPLSLVLISTLVLLIGLGILAKRATSPLMLVGIGCIFVGALSNAMDRFLFGYTIDYLRILNSIINLADIWILVGIYLLIRKHQH